MVALLFWNTAGKPDPRMIAAAAREQSAEVVLLAECDVPSLDLLKELNASPGRIYIEPPTLSSRLRLLTTYPISDVHSVHDENHFSITELHDPIGPPLLVTCVHLGSKLYFHDDDQYYRARRLTEEILVAEDRLSHRNTIVMGDFNMSPFEQPIVAADALHATMDRRIASRISRRVDSRDRFYFYNPMWNTLGDNNDAPGTHYYSSGLNTCYFWNTFDQVLLRPSLLKYLPTGTPRVLSKIGSISLLSKSGVIDKRISDHLPILINLNWSL